MFEALQNLENIVRHFDGTILIITGILSLMIDFPLHLLPIVFYSFVRFV